MWVAQVCVTIVVALWRWTSWPSRRWLTPTRRFGIHDPTIDTVSSCRSTLGILLVLAATARWKGIDSIGQLINDWMNGAVVTVAVSGAALVVGCLIIVLAVGRGARASTLRCLCLPLGVLAGSAAGVAVLVGGITWLSKNPNWLGRGGSSNATAAAAVVSALVMLLAGFTFMSNLWVGGRLLLAHVYRSVDGHPALRPVVAILVCLYTLTTGVVSTFHHGLDTHFPWWCGAGVLFAGPVITAVIGLWELQRLADRHGCRIWTPVHRIP